MVLNIFSGVGLVVVRVWFVLLNIDFIFGKFLMIWFCCCSSFEVLVIDMFGSDVGMYSSVFLLRVGMNLLFSCDVGYRFVNRVVNVNMIVVM